MTDTSMKDPVRGALEFLIQVKQHKEAYGKDLWYQTNQPIAWEAARKALKNTE